MTAPHHVPIVTALTSLTFPVAAADLAWIDTDGGLFGDPASWDPQMVPGDALFVRIGKDPGATGRLRVEPGSTLATAQQLVVGDGGVGELEVRGSVVAAELTFLGDDAAAQGPITVDGPTASLSLEAEAFVGNLGGGSIAVTDGGTALTTRVELGDETDATGEAIVDGSGSTWMDSVEIFVGNFGTGTLSVANGGTLNAVDATIADDPGSVGVASIVDSGSSWTCTGNLRVGDLGTGTLRLENGGQVVVGGDYAQSAASTSEIVIGPATAPAVPIVDVAGDATLAGTLVVELQAGYAPAAGTVYTALEAAAIGGGFATFVAGDGLQVEVAPGVGPVTAVGGETPGDVNSDGSVDVQDLIAVVTAWGPADPAADLDGDGAVGVADLIMVIVHWG